MKSRFSNCITTTALLVALAIPARLKAQNSQGHNNNHKPHRYRVIDLGTFGGPTSWFCNDPNGGGGACGILNSRGAIASGADIRPATDNVCVLGGNVSRSGPPVPTRIWLSLFLLE